MLLVLAFLGGALFACLALFALWWRWKNTGPGGGFYKSDVIMLRKLAHDASAPGPMPVDVGHLRNLADRIEQDWPHLRKHDDELLIEVGPG